MRIDADAKPDCLFVVETTQTSGAANVAADDGTKFRHYHALEAWESERLASVDSEDCGLALTPVTRGVRICLARRTGRREPTLRRSGVLVAAYGTGRVGAPWYDYNGSSCVEAARAHTA